MICLEKDLIHQHKNDLRAKKQVNKMLSLKKSEYKICANYQQICFSFQLTRNLLMSKYFSDSRQAYRKAYMPH